MNSPEAQVRDFITKARTTNAIKVIEEWAATTANVRAQTDIALISSDWTTLSREINTGTAENENNRRNKINKQILNFDWTSEIVVEPKQATTAIKEEVKARPTQEPKEPILQAIKLLFLGANPFETGKLNLKEEYTQIAKRLENEKAQSKLMLQSEFSTTLEDFQEKTNRFRPNIVHFVGHGKDEKNELTDFAQSIGIEDWKNDCGLIFFDSDHRAPEYINALALDYNFETFLDIDKIPINIVIFNACYSINQAEVIAKRVKYVVGVNNKIADGASIDFTAGFYFRLMEDCENVIAAFRYGKGRAINKLKDRNHIVLFVDGEKTAY